MIDKPTDAAPCAYVYGQECGAIARRHGPGLGQLRHKYVPAPAEAQPTQDGGEPGHIEVIWRCKVGGNIYGTLPRGSDEPMRTAVAEAFKTLAGVYPKFTFSGWGAELTEPERAVVEHRLPSEEYRIAWHERQSDAERKLAAVRAVCDALEADGERDLRSAWNEKAVAAMSTIEAVGDIRAALEDKP